MTSFVNDSGEYLDYSGEDLGFTKQAASWYDFKIKGDVSLDFRLPNTAPNREKLGYYGPTQIGFSSQNWTLVRGSNKISRGEIVIKGSNDKEIEAYFVSGNSNWFNLLSSPLKEVDFADSYSVLSTATESLKSATEGIIFPLVDWWANGQHRSTFFVEDINQTQQEGPVFSEWHPCIYLHTVLTQACQSAGIKVSGDLISDPLFKKMVMTPEGPDLFWPDWIINESFIKVNHDVGITYNDASDPQVMQWTTVRETPELNPFNPSDYSWTAPRTAAYQIDFTLYFLPAAATYRIDLYLNGALDSTLYTGANVASVTTYKALTKGQKVQFYIERTVGVGTYKVTSDSSVSFKIIKTIGNYLQSTYYTSTGTTPYICPQAIVPNLKTSDFVKFLSMYFTCVCTYDEHSKTLSINKLSRKKREDAEDWSDYLISFKTVHQTGVAQHNYVQMEGHEDQIIAYNKQSAVSYGGGDLEGNGENFERDIYSSPFSISWDQVNQTANPLFLPYVKFYELNLEEETTYSGVSSVGDITGASIARFTSTWESSLSADNVFFVKSASGEYSGWSCLRTSATATTNPYLGILYGANDSGTIAKYSISKVNLGSRILIVKPGSNLSDANGSTIYYSIQGGLSYGSTSSACLAWSDKPKIDGPIDIYKDSLAIDSVGRDYNHNISERFGKELRKIYLNPKGEAVMKIPEAAFKRFNFDYIYLNTKEVTGYFFVHKIENYKNSATEVKVDLLPID